MKLDLEDCDQRVEMNLKLGSEEDVRRKPVTCAMAFHLKWNEGDFIPLSHDSCPACLTWID